MRISFVVPVYKVEKYLDECVESILTQTYKNFEIILVDDGSPDSCPAMCDAWAVKDNRVKVLHKINGGLSDARNAGVRIATGDYVIFVDSDDFWINKDCLQKLMEVVKNNCDCDFINFNCSYYYTDTNLYRKWVAFDERLAYPTDKNSAMHLLVASGTMPMSACLKVISRKSLLNMGLTFVRGIRGEDIVWFIDLLDGCDKCMFVNHYIYAYRQNVVGSITNTDCEQSFNDLFNLLKLEIERVNIRTFSESAKNDLRSFLAYEFCILLSLVGSLKLNIRGDKRRQLLEYRWLLRFTSNPKVRMVAWVNKILGIWFTEWLLKLYISKMKR